MMEFQNLSVLVLGLGRSGSAAARLLCRLGARVTAIDEADSAELRRESEALAALGVQVRLAAAGLPDKPFALAVASPGIALNHAWLRAVGARQIQVISELELGYRLANCLSVAITGTNGKTTTTELVERVLSHCGRRTLAAGNIGRPLCSVVERTRDLDFLTLEVSSFQLEAIRYFRPVVAVLLNLAADHLDRYAALGEYIRAKARLFMNQQPFDWAIIQSEALAQIRSLGLAVPAKVITFSARNRRADLWLERGMLFSRLPAWEGPLLDLDQCRLRGPHNAENLMAALAVGRVLRIPLDQMASALKTYEPAAHRCEKIAEINGVQYYNDSKATNVDALEKALLTMPEFERGEPNILLIAGGKDKGLPFHDVGPLLSQRVKAAFLIGESSERMRAAWSLFTPCARAASLLEAVSEAARKAVPGDVVLLSPACSSFDMFQDYQQRGEVFRQAVRSLARPMPGVVSVLPATQGSSLPAEPGSGSEFSGNNDFVPGFFEEKHQDNAPIQMTTSTANRCHQRP